ncbi:S9 family peptidase [Parabacteroides sp. Marseille-P3160]|uniref:S9 family peptidase n=1 Tax=Parabacteroides sp. Marseille-P3160 TaxID=1917887 RepID=UPI0009B9C784|nr:S9 family peptidase [Parabacteroides sp. Marseille-P3160]
MNRFCLAFLLSGLFAMGLTAQDGNKRIDLKEVTDGAFNQISSIGELRSLPDGEHYTVLNKDRNRIVKYSYRTGQPVDTLFDVKTARECTFDKIEGYDISSTGYRILVWNEKEPIYRHSFRAMVYDYDVRRNLVKPLSESKEKIMIPTFSPDGRMCAFVVNNNIWLKKFDYDSEVQITKDGVPNQIINGTTDWVYEEEFGITNLMAWAPNSEYLAFVRFDETEVPEYSMQIYGENYYPGFYNYRYPKAGEKNSKVTLHSYSIETKDIKTLTLPVKEEYYIPGITFTTNPDQLAVMTLNRTQNQFNLYYTNPKSGVSRLILNDQSETYIDSEWLNSIRFYNTGFTYVGEKDGYAHVYLYSPTGVLLRQVTSGNWDVTRLLGWDTETGAVYYESAEESPLRRSVYRIDTKGKKTKLSTQEGTNAADFSANFAYYVNRYSNVREPMQITVHETKTGKVLRTLQDNAALKQKLAGYRYSPKEFFTVETASGFELNAWIVKPKDFSESKKYPVLMVQYSGPNSQEVLDKYNFGWEQYLAGNDILVVCVDGRGTGARGVGFRKSNYLRMGELESRDQVEAAQALAKLPYVDGKRIAIWGWSFGGYNTLMSMSVGNGTFKAGIAVAPPTDWRYYDTVYTERYMRTPQENQKGYDATSPIKLAANLQGRLLLVHGTADDNVHFKQSMDYAESLVQAGKQFEMQFYRDRDHGIHGGNTRYHLYTRMSNFLFDHL